MEDDDDTVERIEIDLLLEAVFQRYGYDFRNYTRKSVARRLGDFLAVSGHSSYSEVTGQLLREPAFFHELVPYFSVCVTSLFRDPAFYSAVREHVVPLLRTWPHFKIWHAGCATGEEVYSLAILLEEEGIYERATLYATDMNAAAIDTGRTGIYSLEVLRKGHVNYNEAGCDRSLSDYYTAQYSAAVLSATLKKNITFARHNLVTDTSFGVMQMVLCRNVLIYFDEELQNKVLELLWESLAHGGFLCLGRNETLSFSSVKDRFEPVCMTSRIFKKRVS